MSPSSPSYGTTSSSPNTAYGAAPSSPAQAYGAGVSNEPRTSPVYGSGVSGESFPSQAFGNTPQPAQTYNNTLFNQPSSAQGYIDGSYTSQPQVPRESFTEVAKKFGKEQPVMLRFIWLETRLGLALDNVIPDFGALPLTQFFFFPENDVLGELKQAMERQQWISESRAATLLKQADQLLTLWQKKSAASV